MLGQTEAHIVSYRNLLYWLFLLQSYHCNNTDDHEGNIQIKDVIVSISKYCKPSYESTHVRSMRSRV